MEKLIIFVTILFFVAYAVPTLARMPQTYKNNNDDDKSIAMVIFSEEVAIPKTQQAEATTLGCANTGESCWNGVPCCSNNFCSSGYYNSVCVAYAPYIPWGPYH